MVHHLGWAVRSIDDARSHFESALGLAFAGEEGFPDVRVAFFGTGSTSVELLEPLSDQTDIGVFLAKRGEGLHHLGLKVDDVAAALDEAHPSRVDTLIGLAEVHRLTGAPDLAESALHAALSMVDLHLDAYHPALSRVRYAAAQLWDFVQEYNGWLPRPNLEY